MQLTENNKYMVYTWTGKFYHWNTYSNHSNRIIIKEHLTKEEAKNFAMVMNKLKETI